MFNKLFSYGFSEELELNNFKITEKTEQKERWLEQTLFFESDERNMELHIGNRWGGEKAFSNGVSIEIHDWDLGDVSFENSKVEYSASQLKEIHNRVSKNKNYQYVMDVSKWYSREKAFQKIKELFKDKIIKWKENSRETLVFEYGNEVDYIKFQAEYGDITFTYETLDNQEMIDEIYDDIEDSADYSFYLEMAPKLVISMGKLYENEMLDLSAKEIAMLGMQKRQELSIEDVMVRTSNARCIELDHILEQVKAYVNVIRRITNQKVQYEINAFYCGDCNRYYILEEDYNTLKRLGIICCKVIDIKELTGSSYRNWAEKSVLRQYGYTVNQKDNLSKEERRQIINMVIDNNVMTKERIIDFLQWQVRQNSGNELKQNSISKWNEDIDYLLEGRKTRSNDLYIGKMYIK